MKPIVGQRVRAKLTIPRVGGGNYSIKDEEGTILRILRKGPHFIDVKWDSKD